MRLGRKKPYRMYGQDIDCYIKVAQTAPANVQALINICSLSFPPQMHRIATTGFSRNLPSGLKDSDKAIIWTGTSISC